MWFIHAVVKRCVSSMQSTHQTVFFHRSCSLYVSRLPKSLAATEPLVSPAEATANIIETEDVGAMIENAKYEGMLDEIARLHRDFEHGVAELAGLA